MKILKRCYFTASLLFLLLSSLLQSEEKEHIAMISVDLNTSLLSHDINVTLSQNLDLTSYHWHTFYMLGGYAPLISKDMNVSDYDWNALNTKWVNMRAVAIVALDGSQFSQDNTSLNHIGDMSHYDRFDVRGLRLGLAGTINFDNPWTYLAVVSFNSLVKDFDDDLDDRYTLYDAVIGIPTWGDYGRVQIGKMKEPISMELSMGLVFEQIMERPMHIEALFPSRNVGIAFSDMNFDGRLSWKVGIFNDWLEEEHLSFSDSNQQLIGRVSTVAYENIDEERLLHLGVGYRYEDVREEGIRYETGPEQWFVDPWIDTGTFKADSTTTVNLEMDYLDGPLWLASEYTSTLVDSAEYGNPTFRGYHVTANYFFTGEHRGYNKQRGTVRRSTPILDFPDGGLGALEVSGRYSSLDLSDGAIDGGEMQIASLALIWHPRRDTQFQVQWSRAHLKRNDLEIGSIPIKSDTDIVQFRWVMVID